MLISRAALLLLPLIVAVCAQTPIRNFQAWFSRNFRDDTIVFPSGLKSPLDTRISLNDAVETQRYQQAVEALFGVAVRLKSLLDFTTTNGGNFLVSPLSVAVALGQLLLGARGESRRRLSEMLSTATPREGQPVPVPDLDFHQQLKTLLTILEGSGNHGGDQYVLKVASAFFIQPDLDLRPDYRHAITDLYHSDVVPLNFSSDPVGSQKYVNQWAVRHTEGHINTVLPYPLPPNTATLIANAIYFKGAWEYPFDESLTIPGSFKMSHKKRVAVHYMRGHFEVNYAESERLGCQMVVLPYKQNQAAMYIMLPYDKNYDIRNFTAKLNIHDITEVLESSKLQSVTVVLPRMSLSGSFSLREPLSRFEKLQKKRVNAPPPTPRQQNLVRHLVVKRDALGVANITQGSEQNLIPAVEQPSKDFGVPHTNQSKQNLGGEVQKTSTTYTVTRVSQAVEHSVLPVTQKISTENTIAENVDAGTKVKDATLTQPSQPVSDRQSTTQVTDSVEKTEVDLGQQREPVITGSESGQQVTNKPISDKLSSASNANTLIQNTILPVVEPASKEDKTKGTSSTEIVDVVESHSSSISPAIPVVVPNIENADNHSRNTNESLTENPIIDQHGSTSNKTELREGEFPSTTSKDVTVVSKYNSTTYVIHKPDGSQQVVQNQGEYEDKVVFIDNTNETEKVYPTMSPTTVKTTQKEPSNTPKYESELPQYISGNGIQGERPVQEGVKPATEGNCGCTTSGPAVESTHRPSTHHNPKPTSQTPSGDSTIRPVVSVSTTTKEPQHETPSTSQVGKPTSERPTEHTSEAHIETESGTVSALNPLSVDGPVIPLPPRPTHKPSSDNRVQFDMTGASDDIRFRIDDILHQMWLEVNEKGTEAAAVSAGTVDYSGDIKLVLVDRPFLFFIRHEATLATLFWGTIMDPTGGTGEVTEDGLAIPHQTGPQPSLVHGN